MINDNNPGNEKACYPLSINHKTHRNFDFSLQEAAAVDRAMIEEIMKEMREKPALIIQDPQINTVGLSANQVTLTPAVYLHLILLSFLM